MYEKGRRKNTTFTPRTPHPHSTQNHCLFSSFLSYASKGDRHRGRIHGKWIHVEEEEDEEVDGEDGEDAGMRKNKRDSSHGKPPPAAATVTAPRGSIFHFNMHRSTSTEEAEKRPKNPERSLFFHLFFHALPHTAPLLLSSQNIVSFWRSGR